MDSVYVSENVDCVKKWGPTSLANDIIVCPTDEPLYLSSIIVSTYFHGNLTEYKRKRNYDDFIFREPDYFKPNSSQADLKSDLWHIDQMVHSVW